MRCKWCDREAYAEELTADGFCSAACEYAWERSQQAQISEEVAEEMGDSFARTGVLETDEPEEAIFADWVLLEDAKEAIQKAAQKVFQRVFSLAVNKDTGSQLVIERDSFDDLKDELLGSPTRLPEQSGNHAVGGSWLPPERGRQLKSIRR